MLNKENEMATPNKVNVSIRPETMTQLTEMKVKLAQELGFTPSYSQVIQHLIQALHNSK
jgi:hypothetical protein